MTLHMTLIFSAGPKPVVTFNCAPLLPPGTTSFLFVRDQAVLQSFSFSLSLTLVAGNFTPYTKTSQT